MNGIRLLLAGISVGLLGAVGSGAQALDSTKLVLDWTFEGSHAVFAEAKAGGFFEKNGLDVTVDRGYGSGDSVVKVASGAYDFGYLNINAVIPYNQQNPDNKLVAVFMVYDGNANSIIARKSAGIATAKDLEGKTISAPVHDDSRILFTSYAEAKGIDASKVAWDTVESNLRDSMFAQGRSNAIAAIVTATLAIEKYGVPADDIVVLPYNEVLPDILGQGIVVSEKTAREKPELVKAFVKALAEAELKSIADPADAAGKLTTFDSLIDTSLEQKRFERRMQFSGLTKNVLEHGLSYVTPERLKGNVQIVAKAFDMKPEGDPTTLYSDAFLPPRDQLMVPKTN